MTKRDKIASKILGAARRPAASGGFVVTKEQASSPLVEGNTVVRAFCLGHGVGLEIFSDAAAELAKRAGVKVPDSWDGYFFEAQRCPICDDTYKKVVLRKIADLK
jgi:hypothetical protein